MHPVEPTNGNNRFGFQPNPHQRHHPPLMQSSYYPPGVPQPLMQSTSRNHHPPMNRYPPPPTRPFDLPPHPMSMGNAGLHPPNSNYNPYMYESDERQSMRRGKGDTTMMGTNLNNNRRGIESNGKTKMNNNSSKSNKNSSGNCYKSLFHYFFLNHFLYRYESIIIRT